MSAVGILGGGQLGRMLALAGHPLGVGCVLVDPAADAPAAAVAELIVGPFDDPASLDGLAGRVEVVTYEFENVPVAAARRLAARVPVAPPPVALEVAQDRLAEKKLFRSVGIPTAPFEAIENAGSADDAVEITGLPAILKTRREGYDGKGQHLVRSREELLRGIAALAGRPLILEGFVPFERELSILSVRGRDGSTAFYPLVENTHREGILRLTRAPAPDVPRELQDRAQAKAQRILEALDYVGVLAIEFFHHDGELLANEMAPRVHNSGHWSIEGASTSQFENHLRAVLGWPLGSTAVPFPCAMVNLIGVTPQIPPLLAIPGVHLHLYGKEPRPGRKLGHVTVVARDALELASAIRRIAALVDEPVLARAWRP